VAPTATCPICNAQLTLIGDGEFNAWVCPAGHGLAATLSEVYERAQEDEIRALWSRARSASGVAGARSCPMCLRAMVRIEASFDDDEVLEGKPGDGPDVGSVPVDVCVADQVVWFDDGELDALPADLPDPQLSADEAAAIDQIARTFGQQLVEAELSRPDLAERILSRLGRSTA
jgi:Zn-finger nucleic acid-binding protein